MTSSDEKEVLAWLEQHASLNDDGWRSQYARTLKAMLSRPSMPDQITLKQAALMLRVLDADTMDRDYGMLAAYRALYADMTAPKTKTVWRVKMRGGGAIAWGCTAETLSDARQRAIFYISHDGATHVEITEATVPA